MVVQVNYGKKQEDGEDTLHEPDGIPAKQVNPHLRKVAVPARQQRPFPVKNQPYEIQDYKEDCHEKPVLRMFPEVGKQLAEKIIQLFHNLTGFVEGFSFVAGT